ncbi:adenylate kinase 7 [Neodiprion pinetum]|uniref:adenylate kinase 7 n=1 Tax=Neodiprion pinetum TaxID=441929 RepID=UPI003720B727
MSTEQQKIQEPENGQQNSAGRTMEVDGVRDFVPWRIFVNQIDSYHGKKLADYFPEQIYIANTYDEDANSAKIEQEEEETREGGKDVEDEEEEEQEETKEIKEADAPTKLARKYEVVGTVMDSKYSPPDDVLMIINRAQGHEDAFLAELMRCGVIVYDITQDPSQVAEAQWALEAIASELLKMSAEKPKAFKRSQEVRHFILISTVMTWALSKPIYVEDPELPFTEADYRKRRPHANFKKHTQCEKDVVIMKKYPELKGKLKTIVLCCGITYGDEEGPFHYLFKMAWHNATELPIFGDGTNRIPVLHVRNLPTIVLMFVRDWPKLRYVVAVEHVRMSQKTIVKNESFIVIENNTVCHLRGQKISRAMASGKVRKIAREEAFLLNGVTQQNYDMVTLDLNIEPAYLEDANLEWYTDLPFSMNIADIAREYKTARNLHPVKIVVLGPPASGKTRLAKMLAEHYRVHYVHVESLIRDRINKLTNDIEAASKAKSPAAGEEDLGEAGDETDDDDDDDYAEYEIDEEDTDVVESWQAELDEIRRNLSENRGRLDDAILNKIFAKKLASKECQNQGYVLDGYPKTLRQAKELFGTVEDAENQDDVGDGEEEESAPKGFNAEIMPELVVVLDATDEFLTERLLILSEDEIQGTHYTEEHLIRRFREYRERNTDDNTPLQFFDEMEVHPLFIWVEDDPCPNMFSSFNLCLKKIGRPRNYGLEAEELADLQKRMAAEAKAAVIAETERQVAEELNRKAKREEKMMEWTNLLEKLKEEEESRLCIMGEPLRHYLVKYIFPTLTQGLVKVAELRPDDPVDYLAEYLFRENPEGKMFEPDYTETMSVLLAAIEDLQKDLLPRDEVDSGAERYLGRTEGPSTTNQDDEETTVDCAFYRTRAKSADTEILEDPRGARSSADEAEQ